MWRRRLLLGTILGGPVVIVSMIAMIPKFMVLERKPEVRPGLPVVWLGEAVLATIVQVRKHQGHRLGSLQQQCLVLQAWWEQHESYIAF